MISKSFVFVPICSALRARRSIAARPAYASRQPRRPHGQRRPSIFTTTWPQLVGEATPAPELPIEDERTAERRSPTRRRGTSGSCARRRGGAPPRRRRGRRCRRRRERRDRGPARPRAGRRPSRRLGFPRARGCPPSRPPRRARRRRRRRGGAHLDARRRRGLAHCGSALSARSHGGPPSVGVGRFDCPRISFRVVDDDRLDLRAAQIDSAAQVHRRTIVPSLLRFRATTGSAPTVRAAIRAG